MPRVKIDYVVSVTSEDPDHPASNLLANEVSKRRWLCSAGAGEGAVLLQLKRAVNICGVHIGAHQAAFVEVLVGSADRPVDQYEVLVPRCVFASPAECRRAGGGGAGGDRVRSFSADQLAEGARGRRWDRVRLLCSQPYNKHCQFGLSFIHIYEPEAVTTESSAAEVPAPISASVPTTASAPGPAPSPAPAPRDTLLSLGNYSSDEEEFQPGALFAKHQQSLKKNDDSARCNTVAQIRRASAQALKDIPDANTRLKKTPIESSGKRARHRPGGSGQGGSGQGGSGQGVSDQGGSGQGGSGQGGSGQGGSGQCGNGKGASAVLRGVVFAMSGFVNPERAKLRAAGLALGARYRPDWTSDCTHLICAFPNTPKLKKVVASSPHAHVVSGDWLRACQRTARRQPEAPHALRPHRPQHQSQTPPPPPPPPPPRRRSPRGDDTDDTDDEIEKVRANNKRPRLAPASPSAPPTSSSDNDVSFVCDERFKGSVTLSDDSSTEEEEAGESAGDGEGSPRRPLPPFLEGLTFTVTGARNAGSAGCDTRLLARYVRAYGGLLLQDSELEQGAAVDYVVCAGGAVGAAGAGGARGLRVRADWLWRCHELRALAPTLPYELPS